MANKHIKHLIIGVLSIALAACSISPDIEDRPELKPIVTTIAAPAITEIINNHSVEAPSIKVLWEPVDKATFYVVEYLKAIDYLSGSDFKSFITQDNSFTLGSEYFSNSSDTRYVFRVKAGSKSSANSSILYSQYSELKEGIIVNSFSVSPVIQDSYLTVYSSFPKIRSVLADYNIVSPIVSYYDGDYTGAAELPEPISSNSLKLNSAEEKTITAVLSIDGKEVVRKSVTVQNSVDYYPQPLSYISGSVNQRGAVTVVWKSPDVNKGLESYGAVLKFSIERMNEDEKVWKPLKDSSGNALLLFDGMEDSNFIKNGDTYSYRDETAEPADKEKNNLYKYRVTPKYCMTVNGNEVIYSGDESENNITETCYVQDEEVKSFEARTVSGFDENNPVISGDAEYKVALEWTSYHDLPDNVVYVVTRWDYDKITSSNSSPADAYSSEEITLVYEGSNKSCPDTFTISEEENKKVHNYTYYIQLKDKNSASDTYPKHQVERVNDSESTVSIRTNPSMKEVDFIKSFNATSKDSAFSDKIVLSWEYNAEAIEAAGLDINKVSVHILRKSASDDQHKDIHKGTAGISGTSYEDKDVTPGDSYNYMIRPYYNDESSLYNGAQTAYSKTEIGSTLEGVTGLNASMNTSNSEISVSWNAAEYAHGYNVYYRESGAQSWSEGIQVSEESIQLTPENGIVPGKNYDITVGVIDASMNSKPVDSIAVKGSILGPITPEVSGDRNIKPDYIEVTWDKVENAASYNISILDDENNIFVEKSLRVNELTESDGRYRYIFSSDSDEFRAYATAMEGDELKNKYALSRKYKFEITPVVKNGSSTIEPATAAVPVEGYWIMPPKNITATKASYRDMVTVSWNEVSNATRYNIYRRIPGTDSEWEKCGSTNKVSIDIECSEAVENPGYEYTVSSLNGIEEGLSQNYFEVDSSYPEYMSNFGINLIKPDIISNSIENIDTVKIVFYEVPFATGYYIKSNGYDDVLLKKSDINVSTLKEGDVGYASCENGMVTYYAKRPMITREAILDVSIRSYNEDAPYDSNNTSFSKNIRIIPSGNYIYEYEIVNLVNNVLHEIIADVNTAFNGDWWIPYDTQPYTSRDKTIYAEGCGTKTLGGMKSNAYITVSGYSNSLLSVSGEIGIVPDSSYNGEAGYLGTDPPDYITTSPSGKNEITVTLPYTLGRAIVAYNNVYMDGTKGTYSVQYNGKTATVDSSQVQVRPY